MADNRGIWIEEHDQRRQILLRIVYVGAGLVLTLIVVILGLYGLSTPAAVNGVSSLAGLLLALGAVWALVKADRLEWATHVLFIAVLASSAAISVRSGTTSRAFFMVFQPIVGSALLLPARWSYVYAAVAVGLYVAIYAIHAQANPGTTANFATTLIYNTVFASATFGLTATLSALTAQRLDRLLRSSLRHAQELEAARSELEIRVQERTAGLQQALDQLQQSGETIRQLNAPILPLADGVLALPIIGNINESRAAQLSQVLLEEVYRRRPHTVLLDLTGIGVADQETTMALGQATEAIRLLGAQPVLVGVRAETAMAILDRGLDMGGLPTYRDVQSGLAYAQQRVAARTNGGPGRG
ncbi:MAG TPA: STAS domain-containing protein [Herpetosiphonaceae bacterium]|nr:STAS domain-containing protein [Herpetosiphonaceae bacterium]